MNIISKNSEAWKQLEDIYKDNQFPNKEVKTNLATTLKVTFNQVDRWFINRRKQDKPAGSSNTDTQPITQNLAP